MVIIVLLMTTQAGLAGSLVAATRTAFSLDAIALLAKLYFFTFNRLKSYALMALGAFLGIRIITNNPDYHDRNESESGKHQGQ